MEGLKNVLSAQSVFIRLKFPHFCDYTLEESESCAHASSVHNLGCYHAELKVYRDRLCPLTVTNVID